MSRASVRSRWFGGATIPPGVILPALVVLPAATALPAAMATPTAVEAQTVPAERGAACRCPERPLAEYFGEADEVLLMRLESVVAAGDFDRLLEGVVVEVPWRVAADRTIGSGEAVAYRTARSSAACGVGAAAGDVLAIFASRDPSDDGHLRVDTCSGTRVYRGGVSGELAGFQDVPGRFVVSRLDALSGMDALSKTMAATDGTVETMVGLLDLKDLAHGGNVPLHERPARDAPVITTVEEYAEVESREVGYEVLAAVVFERTEGWSKVRLAGEGVGWVSPESAGTWFPYVELPIRRLAYLSTAWSGHVWPEPGAGIPRRSAQRSTEIDQVPVEVHESRLIGGVPWFRVDVLAESPCEGGEPRNTLSGWVPGYGTGGEHTVWYYSRGC